MSKYTKKFVTSMPDCKCRFFFPGLLNGIIVVFIESDGFCWTMEHAQWEAFGSRGFQYEKSFLCRLILFANKKMCM